ncbi:class I SAM-dependent methyltransferase [Corynebacterium sp.]|uniref:class I SAM-dependent DNA methyltransferase n=1 Tax=Corynebacterium sp. TaxID=1720 RepID=UPI0026DC5C93|nr:class I SAM-dependent methyltransferase [Corynebacterium sp.]MDO5077340.1 class I SAM-dependent methyltransferase [Corynebacterium sp.]
MYFNENAFQWDTPERLRRANILAERIREHWGTNELTTVLEFGCGTGAISYALGDRAENFLGFDTAEKMLSIYRQKADSSRHRAVENLADVGAGTVDAVVTSMVLHHVPDVPDTLATLAEKLRPGGLLTVIDLDARCEFFHQDMDVEVFHHGFDREEFSGSLRAAGLVVQRMETMVEAVKALKDGTEHPYSMFIVTASKPAAG